MVNRYVDIVESAGPIPARPTTVSDATSNGGPVGLTHGGSRFESYGRFQRFVLMWSLLLAQKAGGNTVRFCIGAPSFKRCSPRKACRKKANRETCYSAVGPG